MNRQLPLHWFLVGLACCATLPAAYTLDPKLDVDTWWHMATGRWIVEHRDVPWVDPFSQMSRENPTRWYAYSWLYELQVYLFYNIGGLGGVIVDRVLLCTLSTGVMLAFIATRLGRTPLALIVAILTCVVLMMFAKERPWHFTIAFTTITLAAVTRQRESGRYRHSILLAIMYVLWANIHIQFVYGLFILGVSCLWPGAGARRTSIRLFIMCLAGTLINPYHARLWTVIVEYATQSAAREFVNELMPPTWSAPATMAVAILALMGAASLYRQAKWDCFHWTLLIVASVMAMRMQRDIWFAALAAIGALANHCKFHDHPGGGMIASAVAIAFACIAGLGGFTGGFWNNLQSKNDLYRPYGTNNHTCISCDQWSIEYRNQYYLNHFDHGGWLIWHFHGNYCAIDGRTNLYGDERIRRHFQTWNCESDWKNDPEFQAAKLIFAPIGLPLTAHLIQSNDWIRGNSSNDVIVFVSVK